MEFNSFEEPSPFAPFWQATSRALDADAPPSVSSRASQTSQLDDHQHQPPQQSGDKPDTEPLGPQNAMTNGFSFTAPDGEDRPPMENGTSMDLETDASSSAHDEAREAPSDEDGKLVKSPVPEVAHSRGVAEDDALRAQTEPREAQDSGSIQLERAASVPSATTLTTTKHVTKAPLALSMPVEEVKPAEPTSHEGKEPIPKSPIPGKMVIYPEAESHDVVETQAAEEAAEEARIKQKLKEVQAEAPQVEEAQVQEPHDAVLKLEEGPQVVEPQVQEAQAEEQPRTTITPSVQRRRRRSAFEMLQEESEKHLGSSYDDTRKRRASAIPSPKPSVKKQKPSPQKPSLSKPGRAVAQTPGKRGRPRKSEASKVSTPSTAKRGGARTSTLVSKPPQDFKFEPAPATVRRGPTPKAAAKVSDVPTETPRKRGRPPKSATPASTKPTTPASRTRRGTADQGTRLRSSARRVGSTPRKVPTPRALARVVKRTPPKVDAAASGTKKRGRPPKNAIASSSGPSKPEEQTGPLRRTRHSLGGPETEAVTLKKAVQLEKPNKSDESPARRRGRQPKATTEKATSSSVPPTEPGAKKRGRQPGPAVGKPEIKPVDSTTRRGRSSRSTAAAKPDSKPVDPTPIRRGRSSKSSAVGENVPEKADTSAVQGRRSTASARKGRAAVEPAPPTISKKRGRPSKTVEGPTAKRRRAAEEKKDATTPIKRGRPQRNEAIAPSEPPASSPPLRRKAKTASKPEDVQKQAATRGRRGPAAARRGPLSKAARPQDVVKTAAVGRARRLRGAK